VGKKLGNDYRLWIDNGSGTYSEIKGQQDLTINRDSGLIDTSSKDDGAYGTQAPGLKACSINCEVYPNLPDAAGYGRLETIALASPQVANNFQVRKGGSAGSGSDVVFQASMYVGNFNTTAPKNGVTGVSFVLALAAAPTTDALA
jgi:predicted secreted protein